MSLCGLFISDLHCDVCLSSIARVEGISGTMLIYHDLKIRVIQQHPHSIQSATHTLTIRNDLSGSITSRIPLHSFAHSIGSTRIIVGSQLAISSQGIGNGLGSRCWIAIVSTGIDQGLLQIAGRSEIDRASIEDLGQMIGRAIEVVGGSKSSSTGITARRSLGP